MGDSVFSAMLRFTVASTGAAPRAVAAVTLTAAAMSATVVSAQVVPQPIATIQFSFSNPGARSLGLGGAFVALADDATAAWANPAGLVQIANSEVSVEFRHWSYSTPSCRAAGSKENQPGSVSTPSTDS